MGRGKFITLPIGRVVLTRSTVHSVIGFSDESTLIILVVTLTLITLMSCLKVLVLLMSITTKAEIFGAVPSLVVDVQYLYIFQIKCLYFMI